MTATASNAVTYADTTDDLVSLKSFTLLTKKLRLLKRARFSQINFHFRWWSWLTSLANLRKFRSSTTRRSTRPRNRFSGLSPSQSRLGQPSIAPEFSIQSKKTFLSIVTFYKFEYFKNSISKSLQQRQSNFSNLTWGFFRKLGICQWLHFLLFSTPNLSNLI